MIFETVLYCSLCYYIDAQAVIKLIASEDPSFDSSVLVSINSVDRYECINGQDNLDEDVVAERVRTAESNGKEPLRISRLRKIFPPKRVGRK